MRNDYFDLRGRRALVTGSNRGIGLALALALGHAGARVVLNGRDTDRLAAAAQRFADAGLEAETCAFDVTDRAQVFEQVDRLTAVAPLDILVNNAGMQHRRALEEFEFEDWQRLMDLNVNAVFHVGQAVARHMIARRRGKIVNICSIQSLLARPSIAPYTTSKGAVANLTKGMCADWARYNIQVNGLAPGYFDTELTAALVNDAEFTAWLQKRTPAGRWGQVEELGGAAVFLASRASDFVNGHILYVDGGMGACV